jgi:LacI family transcriptional regulator
MPPRPRVALLIETSQIYGRELCEGVASYVETHTSWSIYLDQRELGASPPMWFQRQNWEGVITRVMSSQLARSFRSCRIPVVDLTDRGSNYGFPRICSDDSAIGRAVAEKLAERGFRNFAFCGYTSEAWSESRCKGFQKRIAESGNHCSVFLSAWVGPNSLPWDQEIESICRWLRDLELPVGVMACNDQRGQQVLESCRRLGLDVPRDVAVIGVDNDQLLCRLSDPPLSSVVPDARGIGYEAAKILDLWMQVGNSVAVNHLLPPLRINERSSSDTYATADQELTTALRFIQKHACEGINVNDVLRCVSVSRSQLEREFREIVGRSPHAQIRKMQLDNAARLLLETDLPLRSVAAQSGFSGVEYFCSVFKKTFGRTAREFQSIQSQHRAKIISPDQLPLRHN